MRKTGSSDDLQDREEGEIRLQRAVDPRFEEVKAANTDSDTGEMAIDILDLLGDRLGSELGLPAMPGGDDDDEPVSPAVIAPAAEGAIAFSELEDESDDEIAFEDEADEAVSAGDEADAELEPQEPAGASRQPGVRSLSDLLANAQMEPDDWSDMADLADDRASATTDETDELPEEQSPGDAEAARWDSVFADDEADDADEATAEVDLGSDMDGDAWPDEMEPEPDSELSAAEEWDATPAGRAADEGIDEDLSLDDLPPEVSEIIGPGPDAPEFEIDSFGTDDVAGDEHREVAEADAFGEEWPFRTETSALEDDDPADMTFEGTDEMTENSMTPDETPEAAAAPARKGFFGRFKKAAPEAQTEESIAEPVEAEPHSYVETGSYEETQADEQAAPADEAPAPETAARKSRKGLLLATTAIAACLIGAGAFVLGPQLGQVLPAQPAVQRPVAAAPVAPAITTEITVAVVEEKDDLFADEAPALTDPDAGLYDPAGDELAILDEDMPDELVLSIDEPEIEPMIAAPEVVVVAAEPAKASEPPRIILAPEVAQEPAIEMPVLSVEPAAEAPVKAEPADIEFTAGLDDPGNGGIDDLFIRDEAPSFTAPAAPAAPAVDLSKYVPLTEFEALLEKSQLLEADIEELREAIELRDEAMMERDEMLQGAISAAARAENLAMSQNEVLVQVYELGAKMDTAESLVVDLSKRLAAVEMTDPADRESVEKRMTELDRRVEGVARDVGLVARMAINGGGKIPSAKPAPAPVAPVMAEPVFDTGVSTVIAPNADPSKIPGDVKIGQTVPGYGEVLDIIPTSDGGRLVVMEHGSAVLD